MQIQNVLKIIIKNPLVNDFFIISYITQIAH